MTSHDPDVVDLLLEQHDHVRTLLEEVMNTTGTDLQSAFDQLRESLARHETAEEMILRPLTRRMPDGKEIAAQRMDEENQSKTDLAALEKIHVDSEEFLTRFAEFRNAVLAHAGAEEDKEFPALRAGTDADTLVAARGLLAKAENVAPTHPHPSAKSTAANYVAGPFAAMLDRARDALSASRH